MKYRVPPFQGRVLVTGGSSLLGKYLRATQPQGVEAVYTWCNTIQPWCAHRMDVRELTRDVRYVFGKVKPQAVIHMGSWGSVDGCQRDYRPAWQVNVEGTRNILKAAADYEAQVLLTSTNAVFDGQHAPYAEEADRDPINSYGKMRERAENEVVDYRYKWQVARLFLLYGWEPAGARDNWASKAVRRLGAGDRLKMADDVYYMPSYAGDVARVLWALLGQGQGVYHVAGDDRVTLHQFVVSVAETWQLDPSLVEPVPFAELAKEFKLAPRPADTAYDLSKARMFGLGCRGIVEGLAAMRGEADGQS